MRWRWVSTNPVLLTAPPAARKPDPRPPTANEAARITEEAWRDPWVFADPGGDGWHMLVTARANHGPADDRGVIGHAVSPDLKRWEVRPPISKPGSGFGS